MVSKITLLELRDAWGFSLVQLRYVMELQHIVNLEHDLVYLALHRRPMTFEQVDRFLKGIYLLTGTYYRLEDVDIVLKEMDE
jgi:hypothetical protein